MDDFSLTATIGLVASLTGIATFLITFATTSRALLALGLLGFGMMGWSVILAIAASIGPGVSAFRRGVDRWKAIGSVLLGLFLIACAAAALAVFIATGSHVATSEVLNLYGILGLAVALSYASTWYDEYRARWKTCPDCLCKVLVRARKCRYCWHWFDPITSVGATGFGSAPARKTRPWFLRSKK